MPQKQGEGKIEWCHFTWNPIKGKCGYDCDYCLPWETKILMADYSEKSISAIQIGDEVLGVGGEDVLGKFGRLQRSQVVECGDRLAATIVIETADDSLECTPEHPIYCRSAAMTRSTDYKKARAVSPYDRLFYVGRPRCGRKQDGLILGRTMKGLGRSMVDSVRRGRETTVFNIETSTSNYFANGFLVHNCYMKAMRERFSVNEELRIDEKELDWTPPIDTNIFVCSSLDIMHPRIPSSWIEKVMVAIEKNPQCLYYLLSKNPRRYGEWMLPENAWMGTTVDGLPFTEENFYNLKIVPPYGVKAARKFVSFEPLKGFPDAVMGDMEADWGNFGWIIIGADSSRGAEKPPDEWADRLISLARSHNIPVFVKDNYKYHTVIKEFPGGKP